jgi:hypothetical protein
MTLAPTLGPIGGIWTGLVIPAHCADRPTVYDRPRPINLVAASEPIQERKVDQIPRARQLPVAQAPPACHPRSAPEFLREHLPRNVTARDKKNVGQTHSIRDARSSTVWRTWWDRQERLKRMPQRIWKQRGGHTCSRYFADEDHFREFCYTLLV